MRQLADIQNVPDSQGSLQMQNLPRMEPPPCQEVAVHAVCEDAGACPFYVMSQEPIRGLSGCSVGETYRVPKEG